MVSKCYAHYEIMTKYISLPIIQQLQVLLLASGTVFSFRYSEYLSSRLSGTESGNMTTRRPSFVVLIQFVVLCFSSAIDGAQSYGLRDDYYRLSCPTAEAVIKRVALANFTDPADPFALRFASGVIRLAFHDCHVDGCDASVLLDGPNAEKTAEVNNHLAGLEIIDKAKEELEAICPGVVSCADIIAYAARDSVVALNGSTFKVQGGRKDGRVSIAWRAEKQLPAADMTVSALTANFKRKGLTRDQMVILSGSHTAAVGHCPNLVRRLYNFRGTGRTDPSIPAAYADQLKDLCPKATFNDTIFIPLDTVSPFFDSGYYTALERHEGVFTSDQTLYDDRRTRPLVKQLKNNAMFQKEFGDAMRAMGAVGIKRYGEIRKVCRKVNVKKY